MPDDVGRRTSYDKTPGERWSLPHEEPRLKREDIAINFKLSHAEVASTPCYHSTIVAKHRITVPREATPEVLHACCLSQNIVVPKAVIRSQEELAHSFHHEARRRSIDNSSCCSIDTRPFVTAAVLAW